MALATSSSQIVFATILTLIIIEDFMSCTQYKIKAAVLIWPSRLEFAENFLGKRSALSLEDVINTSGQLQEELKT